MGRTNGLQERRNILIVAYDVLFQIRGLGAPSVVTCEWFGATFCGEASMDSRSRTWERFKARLQKSGLEFELVPVPDREDHGALGVRFGPEAWEGVNAELDAIWEQSRAGQREKRKRAG